MRPRTPLRAALLVGLALAAPAGAEIYRCPGPDGGILYTSDASQCPGAEAHEPRGAVHSVQGNPDPAVAARRPPPPAGYDPAGERARAASWRERKTRAQHELAEATGKLEALRRAVTWCNRGSDLYATDETGVRHEVPCEDVISERDRLEEREASLRAYLDEGLADECRRAGCLPGWIRD